MACVDWLEVTAPEGVRFAEELAGWADLEVAELPHGHNYYRRAQRLGPAKIDYDGRSGMGEHMTLTGKSCREAEARGLIGGGARLLQQGPVERDGCLQEECGSTALARLPDWSGFFKQLLDCQCKASRMDAAIDVTDGSVTIDQVEAELRARRVRTRWKKWKPDHQYDFATGKRSQAMLRVGSFESDACLRIYDKGLEQGQPEGQWIRIELQLRRRRAQLMMQRIAASSPATMGQAIAGVIMGYISFREGEQTAGKRWAIAGWWKRLLGTVRACSLGSDPKLPTIDELVHWVWIQVAPTLRLLQLYRQGILEELLEGQDRRLTPRHLAVLAAALKTA